MTKRSSLAELAGEKRVPEALQALAEMSLEDLAASPEAARLVARVTRTGAVEKEPVKVSAFNSYI